MIDDVMNSKPTAIDVTNVSVSFNHAGSLFSFFSPGQKKSINALSNITFSIEAGSSLGIVGESGSGKTTLAKTILGLITPSSGTVHFENNILQQKDTQFIFQDPLAALNPKMTVEQLITEPLDYLQKKSNKQKPANGTRLQKLKTMMEQVGLDFSQRHRYAHEFSGGQCQRIGIARAMITQPKVLICDEPVSALDVSVRAQIINLLKDFQQRQGLTLIFIAHDLSLVRYISDKLLVLYQGKLMEMGSSEEVFSQARHPYTQALISAEPRPDPETERHRVYADYGKTTGTISEASGCVYAGRCTYAQAQCHTQAPPLRQASDTVKVACFFPLEAATSV